MKTYFGENCNGYNVDTWKDAMEDCLLYTSLYRYDTASQSEALFYDCNCYKPVVLDDTNDVLILYT